MEAKLGYHWIKHPIALSDKNKDESPFYTGENQEGSLLEYPASNGCQMVDVRRLDSFDFSTSSRIFLKVDTQGNDLNVVLGAAGIMHKIYMIQVECIIQSSYKGTPSLQDFVNEFNLLGFELIKTMAGMPEKTTGVDSHVDLVFQKKLTK